MFICTLYIHESIHKDKYAYCMTVEYCVGVFWSFSDIYSVSMCVGGRCIWWSFKQENC